MKNLFMAHVDHNVFRSVSIEKAICLCNEYDNMDHSTRIAELTTTVNYNQQHPQREYSYCCGNYEFRRFDTANIPSMFTVK